MHKEAPSHGGRLRMGIPPLYPDDCLILAGVHDIRRRFLPPGCGKLGNGRKEKSKLPDGYIRKTAGRAQRCAMSICRHLIIDRKTVNGQVCRLRIKTRKLQGFGDAVTTGRMKKGCPCKAWDSLLRKHKLFILRFNCFRRCGGRARRYPAGCGTFPHNPDHSPRQIRPGW